MSEFTCGDEARAVSYDGGSGVSYDTVHDAASATSIATGFELDNGKPVSDRFGVRRYLVEFDTSSIPVGSIIQSAILKLYIDSKEENNTGHSTVHVVEGVQDLPVQNNDYGDHLSKTISGGSIAYGDIDITPAQYNNITLNATGRAWIVPGGTTKLCCRLAGDINDQEPTYNGGYLNLVAGHGYDGANPPKLEVTYSPGGSTSGMTGGKSIILED